MPNEVLQDDPIFLRNDEQRRTTFKYAMTVVSEASPYKETEPLNSKDSTEVAHVLPHIYKFLVSLLIFSGPFRKSAQLFCLL